MNLRWALVVGCLSWGLAGVAAPEGPGLPGEPSAGQYRTGDDRMNRIWRAHENRMDDQSNRWFEDGDFPQNVDQLRYRTSLWPEDYERLTDLAWMYGNLRQHGKALEVMIAFRLANPTRADAAYPEAEWYFRQKSYAKVIAILEPVIGFEQPIQPNGFRILAHSYERLGFFRDSLRVWDLYIGLNPEDAAAKVNRERVAKKQSGEIPTTPPPAPTPAPGNPPGMPTPAPGEQPKMAPPTSAERQVPPPSPTGA